MLQIKEKPGCITAAEMRLHFESGINNTAALKKCTPLGVVSINGKFSHYADQDTDTMWIGFALGMRAAEFIAAQRAQAQERK